MARTFFNGPEKQMPQISIEACRTRHMHNCHVLSVLMNAVGEMVFSLDKVMPFYEKYQAKEEEQHDQRDDGMFNQP